MHISVPATVMDYRGQRRVLSPEQCTRN